jgi:hypothetical protein
MQRGSLMRVSRKQGPDVWQFRWSERDLNGRRVYRKKVLGSVGRYADEAAARPSYPASVKGVGGIPILPSAWARDLVPISLCSTGQKVRSGPKKRTNKGEQDNAGEHSQELQTQQCVQERRQGTKQNQLPGRCASAGTEGQHAEDDELE